MNNGRKWVESEEMRICKECLDNDFSKCDECDEYFSNSELYEDLCENCYNDKMEEEAQMKTELEVA